MRNSQYFAKVLCFSCLFLVIYAKYYIPEDNDEDVIDEVRKSFQLIIFGIPEEENEDLFFKVLGMFHYYLGMTNLTDTEIVDLRRFGLPDGSFGPRPVKVQFNSPEIPTEAFMRRRKLNSTEFMLARPLNGQEVSDVKMMHSYAKKLKETYPNVRIYIRGTLLHINDLLHDAEDVKRILELEENIKKGETEKWREFQFESLPTSNNTLMIHGVPDKRHEDFESARSEILDFIQEYFLLDMDKDCIVKVCRIGRYRFGSRSIVIRFANSDNVRQVLERRTGLQNTRLSLTNYLSYDEIREAKILKNYVNKLRAEGVQGLKIKGTKMLLNGTWLTSKDVLELENYENQ